MRRRSYWRKAPATVRGRYTCHLERIAGIRLLEDFAGLGLHLLEGGVALHEFFGAAAGEADGELAVFVIAFNSNDGAHAVIRVAHFLAEQRVAVFTALSGWTREGARAGGFTGG